MKKRNLFVCALMLSAAAVAVSATTVSANAQTVQEAQQTPQAAKEAIQYGKLTDAQKALIAAHFDAKVYASQNFDVVSALGNDEAVLLDHFLTKGLWEGRVGCADFDPFAYACSYEEVRAKFGKNLVAYYEDYFSQLNLPASEQKYNTTFNKYYKSKEIVEKTL